MRRLILVLGAILTLWYGGRAIVRLFQSDETQIRAVVESMTDGFNATRTNAVLEGLDARFLDEAYGADKELVRAALVRLFFTAKDETTKGFLYRAETKVSNVVVTEASGDRPASATAEIEAVFHERRGESESEAWRIALQAKLEETDDGWRILRTDARTTSGKMIR